MVIVSLRCCWCSCCVSDDLLWVIVCLFGVVYVCFRFCEMDGFVVCLVIYGWNFLKECFMEIFNYNVNVNFLGMCKFSIGLVVLLMFVLIGLIFIKGLNYVLDFIGGILVEVSYLQFIDVGQVCVVLQKYGFENLLVQSLGGL